MGDAVEGSGGKPWKPGVARTREEYREAVEEGWQAARGGDQRNARKPWDQWDGEPGMAYGGFLIYRDLSPGERTLRAAWERWRGERARREGRSEPRGKSQVSKRFRGWSESYRWSERATAWDRLIERGRAKAARKMAETLEARRSRQLAQQERETLAAAQALKIKAFQMLQMSLTDETTREVTRGLGGMVQEVQKTVKAAKWTFRDAAMMLRVSRELEDLVYRPRGGVEGEMLTGPVSSAGETVGVQGGDAVGLDESRLGVISEKLERFREEQREKRLRYPRLTSPPGVAIDGPATGVAAGGTGDESPLESLGLLEAPGEPARGEEPAGGDIVVEGGLDESWGA